MIPYQLCLYNFMCYRSNGEGPLTLDLDGIHIACLSGENGAGKSTLLDAITWALWGRARMSDDELIAQGESEMHVDLSFQLNGQRYRVTRKRQRGRSGARSGGKSWLDLQVQGEHGWRPLGGGKITETEQAIEQLLRMRYDTFINASFLLQGRADEFTRKTAGERKQVLADILDLRDYTALEERARRRARSLDDAIKGLDGLLAHLQQEADKHDLYTHLTTEADQRAAALTAKLAAAETARDVALAQLQTLEAKLPRRKELAERLTVLRADQQRQEQERAGLHAAIADAEALLQRGELIRAGVADLVAAQAELQRLEGLRDRYDELEQQRQQHQVALKEALAELRGALKQAEERRDHLSRRAGQADAVRAEIAALEQRCTALAPLVDEHERLERSRADLEVRTRRYADLRLRREQLDGQIKLCQDSLISVREEKQRLARRLDEQLVAEADWRAELAAAHAQQVALDEDTARLADQRAAEQATADRIIELRSQCQSLKAQADQLKERQALLQPGQAACPVCGSELGHIALEQVHRHYTEELQAMRQGYAAAKREADAGDRELAQTRASIGALEQQIGARRQAVARIVTLEAQLEQAAAWRHERTHVQTELDTVLQQLAAQDYAPEEQAELRAVLDALAALGDGAALEAEQGALNERLRALQKQLAERNKAEGMLAARQRELAGITAELADLPAVEAQIATLNRTIADGDYAHEVRAAGRAVVAALAELGYSADAYRQAREAAQSLSHWVDEERRLNEAQIRLDADRRLLQQADELVARRAVEIEQVTGEDAGLEQELRALPAAQAQAREATGVADLCRRDLRVAERDLAEKQTLRERAANAAAQLAERQAERQSLVERLAVFQELTEAFGKKGVQAMLIETAIPQIEREANRLLGRMTDNQMHLTFEMQRDTKKGDTVETLEIKIADALGTRTYDAFSGGEAMRVNFAIRVALSRLLAHRAGASLETLVIDEGFGALDALGRERFIEAITSVQQDFKRILVITHIEELKERFPAQIEIIKTAQGSRWELR